MTYSEKLRDPRWQRRRLEILQKADFACQGCFDDTKTLHVHHKLYRKNADPWEYEDHELEVLCEDCHASAEHVRAAMLSELGKCWKTGPYWILQALLRLRHFYGTHGEEAIEAWIQCAFHDDLLRAANDRSHTHVPYLKWATETGEMSKEKFERILAENQSDGFVPDPLPEIT